MKNTMKSLFAAMFAAVVAGAIFSACEDDKTYQGPAQIAFEKKSVSLTVENGQSTFLVSAVQLIAGGAQGAVTGSIVVADSSTNVSAVSVPPSVTIDAGRFTTDLRIEVTYNALRARDTLYLGLTSADVKVAANYNTLVVYLKKN